VRNRCPKSSRKKLENITRLLDDLASEAESGVPIIVEGKNDVDTLHELAIRGEIISAKTYRKTLLDTVVEVEQRGFRDVILLMDFDRRGKEWTKKLTQEFERSKIKSNLRYWKKLKRLVGREVKDIEGLATYLATLKERTLA